MQKEQNKGVDRRPFFLCVSWTHPHDPFRIPARYWDRYRPEEIPPPAAAPDLKPSAYQQWINRHHGIGANAPTAGQTQAARHAYYGMISYLDDLVGEWLRRLERLGLQENTIVVFSSDHGEMLGEHGMWYKRTFHEPSVRVPLIVAHPDGHRGTHCSDIISLIDLFPTFCEWANIDSKKYRLDGSSFAKNGTGGAQHRPGFAYSEYLAEGTIAPMRAVRAGRWKYVYVHAPVVNAAGRRTAAAADGHRRRGGGGRSRLHALLFDLATDPLERKNLAGDRAHQKTLHQLGRLVFADGWDPEQLTAQVLSSQQERLLVLEGLVAGRGGPKTGFGSDRAFWGEQPPLPSRY